METVMQRRAAKSREEGRMEGRKEGRMEGRKEGRMEGRMESSIQAAKGMLREGIDLAVIARVLDMPASEIRQWLDADDSIQPQ